MTFCLAGSVCGKLFPLLITFRGKKFGFVKMSVERCMGDNPFDGFWTPTISTQSPTFYH